MDGGIVHNQNRIRLTLRPTSTMMKKLLDEVFIHIAVCGTLEHSREQYTLLCVSWQDLVSIPTVKASDLHRSHTKRRPTGSSKADSLIASGFVYVDKMVRSKFGEAVEIEVSKICISFAGYLTEGLLRPADRVQGSVDSWRGDEYTKIIPEKNDHFVEIHTGLFNQAFTKCL